MKNIILLLFILLGATTTSYTQHEYCPMDNSIFSLTEEVETPAFGPIGTLRSLVIICKFSDDQFDQSPHTDLWPSTNNSMPSWGPSILSTSIQSNYQDPSISGYFQDMSLNQFNVIGDVYYYQPLFEQSHYWVTNGRHLGYLTEEILTRLDKQINYSNYDNWDPNDYNSNQIFNEPDGKVDMIQICFRAASTYWLDWHLYSPNASHRGYEGIAGLTGMRNTFESGTQLVLDGKIILASTFGSGTFSTNLYDLHGGLPVIVHEMGHYLFGGTHYAGVGYHGLMDGQATGVMSSFERIRMNWLSPLPVSSEALDITIPDAITTGIVRKLNNPGTDRYFLIDNHQRLSFYESTWKTFNEGPLVSKGTGLLISDCSDGGSYGSIDIESAFGMYNWSKIGNLYEFPFRITSVNNVSGEDKLKLRNKNTTQGSGKNHPDYRGSAQDFFNIGYNQVFSPWSNPSAYPDLENLCVELLQFDQYKNAHVNFHTQNAYLASPSKPQLLTVSRSSYNHPLLSWVENEEPDLPHYVIYKYINYDLQWQPISTTTNTYFEDLTENYCPVGQYCMSGHDVHYRVTAMDTQEKESVPSDSVKTHVLGGAPDKIVSDQVQQSLTEYKLQQNYPNPFNPTTTINYQIPQTGFVQLKIYDMLGAEVATLVNETKSEGYYSVNFNAANLPSGVYIYSLRVNDFIQNNKMTVLK